MGGGHSTKSLQESYNTAISRATANTLQVANNSVSNIQCIKVDCNSNEYIEDINKAALECANELSGPDRAPTQEEITLCYSFWDDLLKCGVADVEFTQILDIDAESFQTAFIEQNVEQALEVNMTSEMEVETGFFEFNNETENVQRQISESVIETITNDEQCLCLDFSSVQKIELNGSNGTVVGVSMDSATKLVLDTIQSSQKTQTLIQEMAVLQYNSIKMKQNVIKSMIIIAIITMALVIVILVIKGIRGAIYRKHHGGDGDVDCQKFADKTHDNLAGLKKFNFAEKDDRTPARNLLKKVHHDITKMREKDACKTHVKRHGKLFNKKVKDFNDAGKNRRSEYAFRILTFEED